MRLKSLFFAAFLFYAGAMNAKNTIVKVDQVTENVALTEDVDYVVDSDNPFANGAIVDIANTEHAVLILAHVKPSKCISSYLGNITINGKKARSGTNCQVKMYASGCIVLPYGDAFKPLTCYTEENYEGKSYTNYTIGHTGGYMKSLNNTSLNNQIRSFKLKRGYMVTFAIGLGGWGYSRCFIADQEDLEIPQLPAVLSGKISSYRLFKWWDAQKKGLASDANASRNAMLGTSWTYDWAQGNSSLLPDVEWVPNHIYEDWPSSSSIGSVDGSCHTKNNNEPANNSDDHPQTVETVLDNWQNMMRTGLRLCSPATHDGGWGWHNNFMNEIDARGWRCDVVDFHGYWNSGTWGNLDGMINSYAHNRPVWFSEWIWGSSWGQQGIFAPGAAPDGVGSFSERNQKACYNGTKPILERLNSNNRVERYAYWNGENVASRIIHDGKLSVLGEYYAQMETDLAYNKEKEFVPVVVFRDMSALKGTFDSNTHIMKLSWTDPNGDMANRVEVEAKRPGSSKWETVQEVALKDQNAKDGVSYTVSVEAKEGGVHSFRVVAYDSKNTKHTTNDVDCTASLAFNVGSLLYGQLKLVNTSAVMTEFAAEQERAPYAVMGMISNKNTANGITSHVNSLTTKNFTFRLRPWTLDTPVEIKTTESIDYLLLPPDTVLHLSPDMMLISQNAGNIKGDEVRVVFPEAFPMGVTPVVVAQQNSAATANAPVTVRVYDVTNEGFSVKLVRQEKATGNISAENVNYFACSPGQIAIGGGKLLSVGLDNATPVGGTARKTVNFTDAKGEMLYLFNPYIIAAPQTNNYAATNIIRLHSTTADEQGGVYCGSFRRQIDGTTKVTDKNDANVNGDYIGWFIISDDPAGTGYEQPLIVPTAIHAVKQHGFAVNVHNSCIYSDSPSVRAYNAAGVAVPLGKRVPAGVYVVTNGQKQTKIVVQ